MSGQPYRYAKDVENFRNEYMDALNLRANIDDMNFQANKIYKETGALPPKSTIKDMRTTAEVLMDVEKLKIKIIGDFKGLATPQMVQLVIQRVESSPLNGDGSFFTWFAQNAPELVGQLKKKYSLGIEGNNNDAEQMYLFLESTYSKTKSLDSSVKSAFDRPTNSINSGISPGDMDSLLNKYDELQFRLVSMQTNTAISGSDTIARLIRNIKDQFDALGNTISTPRYRQLKDLFILNSMNLTNLQQIGLNTQGYRDWIEYTDKLPNASIVSTIIDQIKKSFTNTNGELTIKLLNNLYSILPTVADTTRIDRIVSQLIAPAAGQRPPGRVPIPPPVGPPVPPVGAPGVPAGPIPGIVMTDLTSQLSQSLNNVINNVATTTDHQFMTNMVNEVRQIESNLDNTHTPAWQQSINYSHGVVRRALLSLTQNYNLIYARTQNYSQQSIRTEIRNLVQLMGTNQMIGAGLQRAGRPKGSGIVKPLNERIDKTQGIKQGHTHVPFGKYIINKNRLDDDIFSFKHIKGYGVKGYPSKKISRNLSNVIKTIIGGGVPKFNELSNLSEEEKEYLHTVASKAGVMDKLSVPTPSKDSMEQDVHQFNVMKGEILAGNDSSVLIKKFKLLLLKLSKNGSLPKRECQEIMEDLIQLGY
jgi:hypothetical protein